jgi:hypothetical protein
MMKRRRSSKIETAANEKQQHGKVTPKVYREIKRRRRRREQ